MIISQQDWTSSGSDDPTVLWGDWKTKFLNFVDFHARLPPRRDRSNKAPSIKSELKKDMRDCHAAKRKAIGSSDPPGIVQKGGKCNKLQRQGC